MASKEADFDNFWEAPGYLWKIREMSERESEAVMVSSFGGEERMRGPELR